MSLLAAFGEIPEQIEASLKTSQQFQRRCGTTVVCSERQ